MAEKLLLFPCNGNSREALAVVRELNRHRPTFEPVGFIDDNPALKGHNFLDVPVLGGREILSDLDDARVLAVPGNPVNFGNRKNLIESLGLSPERFATVIHPTAVVGGDCRIGVNTLIQAGVVATTAVAVGNHVVILPNAVLSHDVCVEDFVMIGSHVSVSGSTVLEEGCYIGSGARLIGDITIGRGSLVGLGAVVIRSVANGVVVVGNPAKPLG